jgi:PAS domain S-box-containing protein
VGKKGVNLHLSADDNRSDKNPSRRVTHGRTDEIAFQPILYSDVFENLPAISFVIDIGENRTYFLAAANRLYREFSGISSEAIGKPLDKVFPRDTSAIMSSHYDECSLRKEVIEYDVFIPHPVDKYFHTSLQPVIGTGDRIIRIIGTSRDITEEKKVSGSLHEKDMHYMSLVSKLPNIVVVHKKGVIVFVNDAIETIMGYAPPEVIGRHILDFITAEEKPKILDISQRLHEHTPIPDAYETQICRKDGGVVDIEVRDTFIEYEGSVSRLAVLTDITDRKQMAFIEERFRNLAEMLPETIFETDENGFFTYINKTGIKTFGFAQEDIKTPLNYISIFPPHEIERVKRNKEKAFGHTDVQRSEHTVLRKDGSTFPVIIHTVPIIKDGTFSGIRGIVVDITERKKFETALTLNERRLETLLAVAQMNDASLDDIVRFVLAEGAGLTGSTTGYLALINSVPPEIVLHTWHCSNEFGIRSGEYAYHAESEGPWTGPIATRMPVVYDTLPDNAVKGLPDIFAPVQRMISIPVFTGETIVAVAGFGDKNQPYNDADTRQLTLLMNELCRIISHRTREAEISAERERLAVTLRSIGDGVITTDRLGIISLINHAAEQMTGWTSDGIRGKKIGDAIVFQHQENGAQIPLLSELLSSENRSTLIREGLSLVQKNGHHIPVETLISPLLDRNNHVDGAVIVIRDTRDKKRIEDTRMRTIKLESVGILAGGIAHDFNNILTSILGNISLACNSLVGSREARDLLTEAEKAAVRAKGLTQQLLTLAKGGEPVKNTSSIGMLAKDCAEFVLRGSNVICDYDIPVNFPAIDIDEGQIIQVLNNLIINAMQAMPHGGRIRIRGRETVLTPDNPYLLEPGKYVVLSITDSGIGISPEHISKIFDPYFTTKDKGHGLGLATTFSIISKHAGHIEAVSVPGSTTFTIYLPAHMSTTTCESAAEEKNEIRGNAKILVLEDEHSINSFLRKFFNHYGYHSTITVDGRETINEYRTSLERGEPFDIVMLDLTIPGGMGGKETMIELVKIDPMIKALVCSGYSNDAIMANYREFGFIGCLSKPYRVDELNRLLQKTINTVA